MYSRIAGTGSYLPEKVLTNADLERLVSLAPDHLAIELAAVRQVSERWPRVPASGSFDTAFHASLPDRARLFGIPRQLSDAGVVRYGFHGLSYEYVVDELRRARALESRLVVAHLGSGASLAAIGEGASIDTTMGLTPTGGIIMATRSGDLDPGVLFYLARTRGFDLPALSRVVNIDGGLRGLSGTTGDMRTLLAKVPDGTVSAHLGNPGSVFWRVGPFDPLRRRGCECQSDEGSACSM